MILSELKLSKSSDVGLLRLHGYAVREVSIERGDFEEFLVKCVNEFTGDVILLGELDVSQSVRLLLGEWMDFIHQDDFMAVYSDEYEVVVLDYYHPIGLVK